MKRLFFILMTVGWSLGASAEVTLDSCRAWARENYPAIRQYELISQSEHYSVSNAARAWIPQIRFSAQATWQTESVSFPDELLKMMSVMGNEMQGMRQDQYKLQLDLQQNIWDGGKSTADKRIAQAQAREQESSVEVDFYNLESRVDNLFFGILLLEDQLLQTEQMIELLQQNLELVRSLVRNGVALQSDADAVEIEQLTAGQRLEQLRASLDGYREMLSLLVARDVRKETLQRPEQQDVPLENGYRPELSLLDAKTDLLSAQERLIKSASMPQFYAFAQGWYGYPGLNMFKNMENSDWSLNAVVGVRMAWNIGAYYTQSNRLKQLKVSQQQLAVQKETFTFNNDLSSTQQRSEIVRLQKAVADDDRIVALCRSVREAAESQLRNGTISTTDLLRKITEENRAKIAKSLHEIELLKKIYELKHTINN